MFVYTFFHLDWTEYTSHLVHVWPQGSNTSEMFSTKEDDER